MKSEQFNFNSETSAIRGKSEKEPVNKKRNWDRIIYLVILGIILLLLCYYLITSFFMVSGQGRVLTQQFTVRAPDDITVEKLFVEVGRDVERGDRLFSYNFVGDQSVSDSLANIQKQQQDRQEDLLNIRSDIAIQRERLQGLKEKLDFYEQRKALIEKEIKLNAETVHRLNDVEEEIYSLKIDINTLNQELQSAYVRRNQLQNGNTLVDIPGNLEKIPDEQSGKKIYHSPYAGNVTNIFKEPLELALRSEHIISVQRDSAKVLAKVIFERDDARNLPLGTELALRFDNGEPSRGIITDIYAAEADLEPVFNLTGIEAGEMIVAELKPLNEEVRMQWRSLNGMGLTASKTLF